ncbi:MAG: hypothetical protein GX335_09165 [Firmicutes bacterium]|nr:hypothetical protein [Bacillota bacterium]
MRKIISLIVLFFVLGSSAVWAADFDFDHLFQDDLITEVDLESGPEKPEEALLVSDRLEAGGRYDFSLQASRLYPQGGESKDSFRTRLGGQIFLDARPDPNFRVFGKMGLDLDLNKQGEEAGSAWKSNLLELFSDFNYENKVFFRAGKQNAKWGVGYFFSPADLISIGRIDPLDPEAEREGPLALKIHYPQGSNNYYTYLLLDKARKAEEIAVAPKLEYVLGRAELGLGGFYQKDKAPRMMLTLSTSLGESALFAEAVVSKGSDKHFFENGLPVKKDGYFFHATIGATFKFEDPAGFFDFSGAAQYYYDGEGTGFGSQIFRPEDKHNLAAALSWNKILKSKFSASALWLTNLSDRSGLVSTTFTLPSLGSIAPSVGFSLNHGGPETEFGLGGRHKTVFVAVTLGSGSF